MNTIILARPYTVVTSTALYDLGIVWFDETTGKAFRYVEGDAALINDTIAAKEALSWMDDGWEVTNDYSNGVSAAGLAPAGVAISAITEGAFGWIQVSGQCDVLTDGGVSAGDALVLHSVDGEVDTMGDGEEEQVFAVALETDHETVEECGCMLRGLL
ncbi:hypothetical protein CMI37_05245 [Candidatus Pacearchaeota archaeon]|nr:hypothetical protein [Candidatus Pacearchaeota archaeon]|tara:strand:- start:4475 stop:4948 length:474 start_codon:yes stop_codon:yes gene_type:complete